MKKRVTYIPTLQEYMRKRKRQRATTLEIDTCQECDYFRKESDVCLWGDTVKVMSTLRTCPLTLRDL